MDTKEENQQQSGLTMKSNTIKTAPELGSDALLCIGGPLIGEKIRIPVGEQEIVVFDDPRFRDRKIDPELERSLKRTRYRRAVIRFEGLGLRCLVPCHYSPQDVLWKVERTLWLLPTLAMPLDPRAAESNTVNHETE